MKINTTAKITPFLWFDTQAEEAAQFYTSVFEGGEILHVTRYTEVGPGPEGSAMTVVFEIGGVEFTALNGGPLFTFNESVLFVIHCDGQDEIDHFWNALSENGEVQQCGWLKDRFGLSWQVVPSNLGDFFDPNQPEKSAKVINALRGMVKLDLAALEAAADN